jgi:serine O-acetyltransferase
MILFLFLHRIFGDYNKLKKKYNATNSKFLKKFYRIIVAYYNHKRCSGMPLYIKNNGSINFVHGYCGIFISGKAEINNNVTIYQYVTIGSVQQIDSKSFGAPIIGENVILGAGCKIIGNVTIGKNCRIAPNAFVNIDLPENTIFINSNTILIKERKLINKVYQKMGKKWYYLENGKKVEENNLSNIDLLNRKYD